MDRFPKTTIAISLMLAVALVLATIMWMDDFFGDEKGNAHGEASSGQGTKLSELMENDPEAAMAETVARAYLNATTARTAAPFVFESDAIAEKFNNYYRPITGPGSYELNFKQRAIGEAGRAQFLYRVVIQGEKERMLVVLPEGAMPKVFWEHFAEVGDLSWDAFFDVKPKEPVEMRVWAYPDDTYVDGYSQSVWQNYVLHDYAEKKKIMGYARRGTGEDWRIADALKNEPVDFVRHTAVMALVRLTYMTEYKTAADSGAVAEIKEVIATSWLPEEFRAKRAEK